jgi:hypothetical protein
MSALPACAVGREERRRAKRALALVRVDLERASMVVVVELMFYVEQSFFFAFPVIV